MALAFPRHSWWLLIFPSLGSLFWVVSRVRPGRGAVYGAWWMMAFMLPLISWTQTATGNAYVAWFALSAAQAFFAALWGASFAAASRAWPFARTIVGQTLVAVVLWVALEEVRSRFPYGGFPWGKTAYPQVDTPLVALAPIGGEVLVASAVVAISVLLMRAVTTLPEDTSPLRWVMSRSVAAFVALALFVLPSAASLPTEAEEGSLHVAIIQGNVEIPMYETFSIPRKVTGNHARVTHQMLDDGHTIDLMIWGENATDIDPRTDPETRALVQEVVDRAGVPLTLGLMEYEGDTRYNWQGVWDPEDGLLATMYGKQHPVPWGEYVPMRKISEILATAAAQVNVDMTAVDNPALIDVRLADGRNIPLVVGICFEVAYEPLLFEGIELGGEAILIPTNNAHFENTDESVQQLQMGQFRAAEFSRAMIQASTNGVSAVVSPDGSITEITGTQEAAYIVADIPLRSSMTPFSRVGKWVPGTAMILGLLVGAFASVSYRKQTGRAKARPVESI